MREIKFNSEQGSTLIIVVGIIIGLGTLGFILATLSSSSNTLQMLESEDQRAFYAAQTGMEYGIKEYLAADDITEWDVSGLDAGDGVTSDVSLKINAVSNEIIITSVGKSARSTKILETVISNTDSNHVPDYAVFSKRPVENVVTKDSLSGDDDAGLVYENAPAVPVFDNDKLRALAKQTQSDGNSYYFEDDLVITEDFNPPDGTIVFTEGKLNFAKGAWEGNVHFVAMDDISFSSTWRNSDEVNMTVYLGESDKKIWIEPRDYDDDPIVFDIGEGEVVPQEPFAAKITMVGCGNQGWDGGLYTAPVTMQITIGGEDILPFGPNPSQYDSDLFSKIQDGDVNVEDQFPMEYILPNIYPAGTAISVMARNWWRHWLWKFGWKKYDLRDEANSTDSDDADIVKVLRNGDAVPNVQGFGSQSSAEEFLAHYIDFDSKRVTLDDNQAIYLFELSKLSPSDPGTDYQDLVVLISLAKEQDDFITEPGPGDAEDGTILSFTGGIISHAPVHGTTVDIFEDTETISKIQVVRDEQILKDFLKYSVNGNSRVLLKTKWTRKN